MSGEMTEEQTTHYRNLYKDGLVAGLASLTDAERLEVVNRAQVQAFVPEPIPDSIRIEAHMDLAGLTVSRLALGLRKNACFDTPLEALTDVCTSSVSGCRGQQRLYRHL